MADDVLDDGFGNIWYRCRPVCGMEIVRPGKVQCTREGCEMEDDGRRIAVPSHDIHGGSGG